MNFRNSRIISWTIRPKYDVNIGVVRRRFSRQMLGSEEDVQEVKREEEEHQLWLRSPDARKCMENLMKTPLVSQNAKFIGEYISLRSKIALEAPGKRMVSSLLSAPLSLGYALKKVQECPEELKVLVIGARAEATLPSMWWREALVLADTTRKLSLGFLGPDCPSQPARPADLSFAVSSSARSIEITPIPQPHMKLHEHPDAAAWLRWSHVVLLMNPGLGSPSCGETGRRVSASCFTRGDLSSRRPHPCMI